MAHTTMTPGHIEGTYFADRSDIAWKVGRSNGEIEYIICPGYDGLNDVRPQEKWLYLNAKEYQLWLDNKLEDYNLLKGLRK